ncbi:MAG: hypothetical protein EBV86_12875 [Marivivens sp.]|nr:hypothetical protein [Marivivens sp.]NCW69430.1 hypothetical protein [Marivivens sp.]
MQYIIVLPTPTQTSERRAYQITRELYNISRPVLIQAEGEAASTVFGIVVHPDGIQNALQVDTDYLIHVHEAATLEKLVACFPELSNDERFELSAYVQTNHSFPFEHIIPSTTTVRDHDYMVQNGWFEIDDI